MRIVTTVAAAIVVLVLGSSVLAQEAKDPSAVIIEKLQQEVTELKATVKMLRDKVSQQQVQLADKDMVIDHLKRGDAPEKAPATQPALSQPATRPAASERAKEIKAIKDRIAELEAQIKDIDKNNTDVPDWVESTYGGKVPVLHQGTPDPKAKAQMIRKLQVEVRDQKKALQALLNS